MEGGEKRSQSHSRYYDWLGPYPTQNTREQHIPIFPVADVVLTPHGNNHYTVIYYWLPPAQRLL